jgi:hypothetical protein
MQKALAALSRAGPHPALSRKRERGKRGALGDVASERDGDVTSERLGDVASQMK